MKKKKRKKIGIRSDDILEKSRMLLGQALYNKTNVDKPVFVVRVVQTSEVISCFVLKSFQEQHGDRLHETFTHNLDDAGTYLVYGKNWCEYHSQSLSKALKNKRKVSFDVKDRKRLNLEIVTVKG